jgi:integrase
MGVGMASLRFESTNGRNGYRLQFRIDGRGRSMWLGDFDESEGKEWKRHIEHLIVCKAKARLPHESTIDWLESRDDDEHAKVSNAGLTEARKKQCNRRMTLGQWLDEYIGERADVKASTLETYEKAKDCLIAYFGSKKQLRDIEPADAKRWRIWLATKGNRRDKERKTMADATVRRRTGKAKQFFKEAMERGLIKSNPFSDLVSTSVANKKRQFFVPADWITRCIKHAPDRNWKTILALARFAGLRCPSEVLGLRWVDVNLPEGRMTIHATKTEHHAGGGVRSCPIFPELRPHLEAAWDEASEGAVYVVERYRGKSINLRTRFEAIIEAAGLTPWPKLYQNLRATRETELMAKFPAKDVASWLGNSVGIAMAHYAMETDEAFQNATKMESVVASVVASQGNQQPHSNHHQKPETSKNQQKTAPDGAARFADGAIKDGKWALRDGNNLEETRQKPLKDESVVASVVASRAINDRGRDELLAIWDRLGDTSREALLTVARQVERDNATLASVERIERQECRDSANVR